jgi:hypothetical protein
MHAEKRWRTVEISVFNGEIDGEDGEIDGAGVFYF